METAAFTMLLFGTVSADLHFGKHVYISTCLSWTKARVFCRMHFTSLSPITSLREEEHLRNVTAGLINDTFWTGLFWNSKHFQWVGGSTDNIPPSVTDWDDPAPHSASLCFHSCNSNRWKITNQNTEMPFFCISLVIMEIRMSWEEAVESCRQNHTSLTSVTSNAELLLAKKRIRPEHITDRVWIGLRFLRNRWMWMNMDPLEYQAWPEDSQDHQCPVKGHCGALNKQGLWENWDCQEKLHFICS